MSIGFACPICEPAGLPQFACVTMCSHGDAKRAALYPAIQGSGGAGGAGPSPHPTLGGHVDTWGYKQISVDSRNKDKMEQFANTYEYLEVRWKEDVYLMFRRDPDWHVSLNGMVMAKRFLSRGEVLLHVENLCR